MADKTLESDITDTGAEPVEQLAKSLPGRSKTMPGPSTNPATNVLIADIALRSAGRLVRNSMEKGMLRAGFERDEAREIVDGRTMLSSLILYGASKVATRSLPGALLVGGGLIAKTLFDRGMSRREAQRRGRRELEIMSGDEKGEL